MDGNRKKWFTEPPWFCYNKDMRYSEFYEIAKDLIKSDPVQSMAGMKQHGAVDCLDHSIFVAAVSYRWASRLGLDVRSTVRGALLHDLFLYDWRTEKYRILAHGFSHAEAALRNADRHFTLSDTERNIIASHMWPMGKVLPRTKEAVIVSAADKFCAMVEALGLYRVVKPKFSV